MQFTLYSGECFKLSYDSSSHLASLNSHALELLRIHFQVVFFSHDINFRILLFMDDDHLWVLTTSKV